MENRFIQLCDRIGITENVSSMYQNLSSMYSEPNRFYHNIKHIGDSLKEFDSAKHLLQNPNLVELALWYHDAIYDTKSRDNEERSAQLLYEICKAAQIPKDFANRIRDLILSTKHDVVPKDIDSRVIVDIDLAIFGKSPEEFAEYEKNIRREYFWVPKDQFKQGRSVILQGFLRRAKNNSLYLTNFFRNKYESEAERNISYALEKLDVGSVDEIRRKSRLSKREMKDLPEAGMGLFSHWHEFDEKEKPQDVSTNYYLRPFSNW